MSRFYLVHMPKAEARHLAGVGRGWPASPETACVEAVREWLDHVQASDAGPVSVSRIAGDLRPVLSRVPVAQRPARGPFGPGGRRVLSGRVEYLGGGVVRLDDVAVSSLAGLPPGEDFRAELGEAGPVLTVGADRYLALEEEPDPKP